MTLRTPYVSGAHGRPQSRGSLVPRRRSARRHGKSRRRPRRRPPPREQDRHTAGTAENGYHGAGSQRASGGTIEKSERGPRDDPARCHFKQSKHGHRPRCRRRNGTSRRPTDTMKEGNRAAAAGEQQA